MYLYKKKFNNMVKQLFLKCVKNGLKVVLKIKNINRYEKLR